MAGNLYGVRIYFILVTSRVTRKVEIYIDCQSLCDLIGQRKDKLEKNNFMIKKGKVLQHAELYK